MNLSYNWLKELVPFDLSPEALAEKLTHAGCCVEEITPIGDDFMLNAEVTTNRPDWLCHWGVAHEIASLTGLPFNPPEIALPPAGEKSVTDLTSVTNEAEDLCPRYTARVITGVKVGPSPEWLQTRLEAVGLKPRNNVVDITNLILFEMNQPLHAFDYDLLKENRIVIRKAAEGEAFTSVFGEERKLKDTMCVIADGERAVALAGVKGGLETGVVDSTTNILLESAYFTPGSTRRASRAAQLDSDSSYRFERGIDPGGVERASARAAQLICELCGGTLAEGVIDTNPDLAVPWETTMRFSRCDQLLGMQVPHDEIERIFIGLGLTVMKRDGESITLQVPTVRQDLTREVDLIEEVARCHGFDQMPEEISMKLGIAHISPLTASTRTATEVMVGLGYHEVFTDSFVQESFVREFAPLGENKAVEVPVRVRNPIREDRPFLRTTLIPGLLEVRRVNRLVEDAAFFDINRVFIPASPKPDEPRRFALVDDRGTEYVRGAFERVLDELRIDGGRTVHPVSHEIEGLESGTTAELHVNGNRVAIFGLITKAVSDAHDLIKVPAALEADFDAVAALPRLNKSFVDLPRFPAVGRDIALVVPETVQWAEIEAAAKELEEYVESIEFASVFRGKQIAKGRKSMAFSIRYRHPDRSFTDEEVNALRDSMVEHLLKRIPDSERR
ncbi:MAG: phenylalanine--tRNA ligase subunit beta [Planctomycetota bacterium]|jgi:phenylalanyl-tRNA synthetase beta chain